ncbi:MAG: hypothetical protein GF409_06460 [Candidatus Omnitrophica bacterium]|nr:hypothetical protein [Candidatus Omnitrophota bacterium]
MPGGDRTGPRGLGPMTGRGAGYCAGYSTPGYVNPVPGSGYSGRGRGWSAYGRGRGGGRGWRNWYYATGMPGWQRASYGYPAYGEPYPSEPTAEEEKEMLMDQAENLKRELEDIQDRISTLEKARENEKK